MKPHGINNIQLETVGEAFAAAEAFQFAADHGGDEMAEVLAQSATALRAHAEAHQLAHGEDSGEPYSLIMEGYMAEMGEMIIRVSGEAHPDPLVRDTAAEMTRSYAENVFNAAMGEAPPPEQPPQYRSPFGE